jgi:hypothetical protein
MKYKLPYDTVVGTTTFTTMTLSITAFITMTLSITTVSIITA